MYHVTENSETQWNKSEKTMQRLVVFFQSQGAIETVGSNSTLSFISSQKESYETYDILGPIWFAFQFYALRVCFKITKNTFGFTRFKTVSQNKNSKNTFALKFLELFYDILFNQFDYSIK